MSLSGSAHEADPYRRPPRFRVPAFMPRPDQPNRHTRFKCQWLVRILSVSRNLADHFVSSTQHDPPRSSSTMEIKIRKAGIDDLKHLLHHRHAMFEEMGFRDPAVLSQVQESSREYFTEALRTGAYKAWVAENEKGSVVGGGGIVIANWPGYPGENLAKRVWILNMYTEPEARRCGVANKILKVILDCCRAAGFRSVSLHASSAGRPLYEAAGFQPTNEMRVTLK